MFLECSTCFVRHTAHHRELKNCNCSLWFYIRFFCCRPLMMGGVSPETCWAIKKHWNNKFYYTAASCWFFLWDLYYDARIHEHHDLQHLKTTERLPTVVRNRDKVSKEPSVTYKIEAFHLLYSCWWSCSGWWTCDLYTSRLLLLWCNVFDYRVLWARST